MGIKSPLAGDINWMETWKNGKLEIDSLLSPLAGDINWMETIFAIVMNIGVHFLSPLAGDINWMETAERTWERLTQKEFKSPLAGDINWMETLL